MRLLSLRERYGFNILSAGIALNQNDELVVVTRGGVASSPPIRFGKDKSGGRCRFIDTVSLTRSLTTDPGCWADWAERESWLTAAFYSGIHELFNAYSKPDGLALACYQPLRQIGVAESALGSSASLLDNRFWARLTLAEIVLRTGMLPLHEDLLHTYAAARPLPSAIQERREWANQRLSCIGASMTQFQDPVDRQAEPLLAAYAAGFAPPFKGDLNGLIEHAKHMTYQESEPNASSGTCPDFRL